MGFRNWLKGRFKREEEEKEEIRINSQDSNIFCDKYCENIVGRWLEEAKIKADGLSSFLKFLGFKMPAQLTELKLWEKTSITCTDANGRKIKLIFEGSRHSSEEEKLVIEEEGRATIDYTAEEMKEILDFYS